MCYGRQGASVDYSIDGYLGHKMAEQMKGKWKNLNLTCSFAADQHIGAVAFLLSVSHLLLPVTYFSSFKSTPSEQCGCGLIKLY